MSVTVEVKDSRPTKKLADTDTPSVVRWNHKFLYKRTNGELFCSLINLEDFSTITLSSETVVEYFNKVHVHISVK